jgi:penicillin-binding protein 2
MPEPGSQAPDPRPKHSYAPHCRALRAALLALFLLLAAHVAWIQVFRAPALKAGGARQQQRLNFVPAKRGDLLDRHGLPLNISVPSYDLALRVEMIRDPRDTRKRTLDKMSAAIADLGIFLGAHYYRSRPSHEQMLAHLKQNTPMPMILWRHVEPAALAKWAERRHDFPGTETVMSWKRRYEYPDLGFHVRGFTVLGLPAQHDFTRFRSLQFKELIGAAGIEQAINGRLRGEGGYELLQTDVLAFRNRVIETQPAIAGDDIRLTLDIQVQDLAESLFNLDGLTGAAVVMDAVSGEVIVCASAPTTSLPPPSEPLPTALVNRAIAGHYPPGSAIKPLIALVAAQEGVLSTTETIDCPGYFTLSPKASVACSRSTGHGSLTLSEAIAQSCNVFFCTVGTRLGAQGMGKIGPTIGLGNRLYTELWRAENPGVDFSPDWVAQNRSDHPTWTTGDSANAAIGQGAWIITPMQMAVLTAAVTTGRILTPTFIKPDPGTAELLVNTIDWPQEAWQAVLEGMRACVEAPLGTGRSMRMEGVSVLAKTGTAENVPGKAPHAWTIAALPAEQPTLVGVCVVEHGGSGGRVAAPILKKILAAAWNAKQGE